MSSKSCTHIKVTGVRCGSPALRGEQFCYFHQRMVRGVRTPPQARLHPIALIEDEESIQSALMEVINALMRNTIDLKRAALILRALHIAVKNAQRARLNHSRSEAVTEIPNYARPAEPAQPTEFDFPATAAPIPTKEEQDSREAADFRARWQAGGEALAQQEPQIRQHRNEILHPKQPHVGTAALGCPGGPEVPGRSAVAAGKASERKPPVSVKDQITTGRIQKEETATAPAPKERKIAAHGASRG
ncbi:MAG TPA: hypothetical protein VGG04_02130 [Candidatus Sulfotelmatobacter sp.]